MKYNLRSLMQFTIRDVLWLMTVVALLLALIYAKRPSQIPAAPAVAAPPIGRYQIMSDPKSGYVFLLDSATGRAWRYYSGEWSDSNSPAAPDE
ncbi:MAG TPA: hypothetical protein VFB96_11980 [Pirellulaceae bacterium]|nr:hypothetical protein [Pirellulaceae bacterium]